MTKVSSLGSLMMLLVLMLWADAFAACPSTFSLDFSGAQYTDCFRDLLRGSDIGSGLDLGGTSHTALNFTGSTGTTASTWLTVYDATPAVADGGPTFGAETLCADVLIHPSANLKGAGVVALLNEGAGKKGLALFISDAGNTDTLILSTVDADSAQKGKLTTLTSVSLQGGVFENQWYRVVMTVDPAGTPKVTGKVFKHTTATDPTSALGAQMGATLTYSPGTLPVGVSSPGENGLMAAAISAPVNSSVTNFTNDPVKCGVSVSTARYVDNGDGTVTDTMTGLMWEKKVTGSGCTHCVDDTYTMFNAATEFLAKVNNGFTNDPSTLPTGLAGHIDWRLANIVELQTILDTTVSGCGNGTTPCIDPIFGPTAPSIYWSSSILARNPVGAWYVYFANAFVSDDNKDTDHSVRAVRGGL